ncbi:MAG: energy transducer TonB [Kiritimatiellales bacterium]
MTAAAHPFHSRALRIAGRIAHVLLAAAATAALLFFLCWLRWNEMERLPKQVFRTLETAAPVSLPPPPPPSVTQSRPELPDLPELAPASDPLAPPLKAARLQPDLRQVLEDLDLDPARRTASTAASLAAATGPVKTTWTVDELDRAPTLINRPSVSYPVALARQGITEGLVVLSVSIDPAGRVAVRDVISATHPGLEPMARRFAERARFTAPMKDGRSVTAVYHWPMVLKQ